MNKYAAKYCPYCKSVFLETDEVVECDVCETPHHKECWIINGRCTTVGCKGKIKVTTVPDEATADQPNTDTTQNPESQQTNDIPSATQHQSVQSPEQQQINDAPPVAQRQIAQSPIPQQSYVTPNTAQYQFTQNYAPQTQQGPAFCVFCGNKHWPGDIFCRKCGRKTQIEIVPLTPEEQNKRKYDQAVKFFEEAHFDEALHIFTELSDYSDSKEKAELCVEGKINAQTERLYLCSVAVLNKPKVSDVEIKAAIEILNTISDYKDAKAKIAELEYSLELWYEIKDALEMSSRIRRYKTALSLVSDGKFDDAIEMFTYLGDYEDSKEQIEKTLEAKEEARKEQLYTKSLKVLTAKSVTEKEIKDAIEALKSLEDYKDSEEKIPEVEARLDKWYMDKAAAEEAERIRRAKAKAKAKKITVISCITLSFVILIVAAVLFATKEYTIEYTLNGGTTKSPYKTSYTLLTKDIVLQKPTKEGYTFTGWSGTDLETPTISVTISKWSFGDRYYTANWKANSYTVKFDTVGGEGSTSQTVTYDSNIVLPTPKKEGYTFEGWYANNKLYPDGVWSNTSDLTLTAKWTANSYNITYNNITEKHPGIVITLNPNYTGATTTQTTITNGQTLTYPTPPTRLGYAFTGWYTNSTCTTQYSFTGNITANITLYAGWQALTVTNTSSYPWSTTDGILTSTNKGSSSNSEYKITATAPMTVTFEYKTSSEAGYDYLYIKKNGTTLKSCSGTTSYASYSVSLTTGDYLSFVYKKDSSGARGSDCAYISNLICSSAPTKTSTAKAVCATTNSYEYTTGSTYTQSATFDTQQTLLVPVRRGYAFLGWYIDDTKVESGIWKYSSDVTLTAKWQAGGNTITLNANGGTVSTNSVAVTYDKLYTLPTPTRTGYTFDGWYSGGTKYQSGTWKDVYNLTLVAMWTPISSCVTLNDVQELNTNVTITLNPNYTGSTSTVYELNNGETLPYPAPPTRSGYAFVGWYTDSTCSTAYDFSGTITDDITLYAKWYSMTSSYSSREYIDIASYASSSATKLATITSSSSSSKHYYYFTCYKAGTYTLYLSRSSGDYYVAVYNATKGTTLLSQYNMYGSYSSKTVSITASAGDVIYISFYNYSGGSTGKCTFYMSGASYPTSTATANCSTVAGYIYNSSSEAYTNITYGSTFTLPTLTREGYNFLGWYNGNTKIESGTWSYTTNLTLTPRWQEIVKYSVTFNNATLAGPITVTLNPNYTGSTNTVYDFDSVETLPYPAPPTRSGYAFAGWYTDSACTKKFYFNESITQDITLYADWEEMQSSSYGRQYIDIANYTTSSAQMRITASSYSGYNYYYFTCYKDGSYTIYATWIEGDFKFNVSNVTKNSTIISDYNLYSSKKSTSQTFTANAGDVICVRTARYSSEYNYVSNGTFYVSGASYPTSTAVAQGAQTSEPTYSYGSSYTVEVEYGKEFILPTLTRSGYTFLGWYNGSNKVESGIWNIDYNVTLTPKWS